MKQRRIIVPLTPELAVVWERFEREDCKAFLTIFELHQQVGLAPEKESSLWQEAVVAASDASRTLRVLQSLLRTTYDLTPTTSIMRKGSFLLWYDE